MIWIDSQLDQIGFKVSQAQVWLIKLCQIWWRLVPPFFRNRRKSWNGGQSEPPPTRLKVKTQEVWCAVVLLRAFNISFFNFFAGNFTNWKSHHFICWLLTRCFCICFRSLHSQRIRLQHLSSRVQCSLDDALTPGLPPRRNNLSDLSESVFFKGLHERARASYARPRCLERVRTQDHLLTETSCEYVIEEARGYSEYVAFKAYSM